MPDIKQILELPPKAAPDLTDWLPLQEDGGGVGSTKRAQLKDLAQAGLSQYLVGEPDTGAKYTSVQTAIDAAVTDGHDETDPALVLVLPGIYTEAVTMKPGIHVSGGLAMRAFHTRIDGTVTVDLAGGSSVAANRTSLSNLYLTGSPAVHFTGTDPQQLFLNLCSLEDPTVGLHMDNTGFDGSRDSLVVARRCRITGKPALDLDAGRLDAQCVDYQNTTPGGIAIDQDGGKLTTRIGEIEGTVDVAVGGTLEVMALYSINAATVAGLTYAGAGVGILTESAIITTFSPLVSNTGGGVLLVNEITGLGGGVGLAGTTWLPQYDENIYIPATPADWVGAPPTTIRIAIDRISSLVAATHGAIP